MVKRTLFLIISACLMLLFGASISSAQGAFPAMLRINFEVAATTTPVGYLSDIGSGYGDRGGGFFYGWVEPGTNTPEDLTLVARERNIFGLDVERDTLVHFNLASAGTPGWWEIAVPDGDYRVTVTVGDEPDGIGGYNSAHYVQAEGAPVITNFVGCCNNFADEYQTASVLTTVSDGRLTLSDVGGDNTKINSVYIEPIFDEDGDGILDIPVISVPNEGTIQINASAPVPLRIGPGDRVAVDANQEPIVLPADNIGQGFDTYIVTEIRVFEGQVWFAIFLGSASYGWVPLNAVEVLTEISGLNAALASAADYQGEVDELIDGTELATSPILEDGYLIVNTSRLNMRSGDGPQYSIVTILRGGQELFVRGRNADATWWFVNDGANEGWVNNEFVVLRGDLTDATVEASEGDVIPPTFFVFGNSMTYAERSTLRSDRLCEVAGNVEYPVVGRDRDGAWFLIEITCGGQPTLGWIQAENGGLRNGTFASVPVR